MAKYSIGDSVTVRADYPLGHIRTPFYIRGQRGVIADSVGAFKNPESAAVGGDGLPKQPLYRVRFRQADTWPNYQGSKADTLDVEIYEHWLTQAEDAS
ncbi:MAG: nitrile hydratase subunit beta [Chromatiales bacterium]|jgi:nitrile hydratase subunit beta|nr:nitrile hydratase subunit beta [Chromatiales bacterium]